MKTAPVQKKRPLPETGGRMRRAVLLSLITVVMLVFLTGCLGGMNTEVVSPDDGASDGSSQEQTTSSGGTSQIGQTQSDWNDAGSPQNTQSGISGQATSSDVQQIGENADGTQETWLITKETFEKGVISMHYSQRGNIVTDSNGTQSWQSASAGGVTREAVTVQVSAAGLWSFTYPGGMTAEYTQDGFMTAKDPNGVIISVSPDWEIIIRLPDGTTQTKGRDGTLTTAYPDGTVSTLAGTAVQEAFTMPEASNRIYYPFGLSSPLTYTVGEDGNGSYSADMQGVSYRGSLSYGENGEAVIAFPGGIRLSIETRGRRQTDFPNGVRLASSGLNNENSTITILANQEYVVDRHTPVWNSDNPNHMQSILTFSGISASTVLQKDIDKSDLDITFPDGTVISRNNRGVIRADYPGGVKTEVRGNSITAVTLPDEAVPEDALPASLAGITQLAPNDVSALTGSLVDSAPHDTQSIRNGSADSAMEWANTAVSGREEEIPERTGGRKEEIETVSPGPGTEGFLSTLLIRFIVAAVVILILFAVTLSTVAKVRAIKRKQEQQENMIKSLQNQLRNAAGQGKVQERGEPSYRDEETEKQKDTTDKRGRTDTPREKSRIRFGAVSMDELSQKGYVDSNIRLTKRSDGELIGEENNRDYDVYPVIESDTPNGQSGYIDERTLRHSAIPSCFLIDYNGYEGKKFRITIQTQAKITPERGRNSNEYKVRSKGKILVTGAK